MDISETAHAELVNLLGSLNQKIGASDDAQELQREAERHLQALQDSFRRLIKFGRNDVFVIHLMEQLQALAAVSVEATSRGYVRVTEHQFKSAELILHALGAGPRLLRYTWKINPAERLFEDAGWRNYFQLSSSMAIAGAMEVRTILIVDNGAQCDAANVQKLLEFFACQEKLTAKIVLSSDWNSGMVDYAIPSTCMEFGIFGENLLYQAETYTPLSMGLWSKDSIEIKRFTHFFDAIWHTVAANNPASASGKMNLSQLMRVDSEQERRQAPEKMRNTVHEAVARLEERVNPAA